VLDLAAAGFLRVKANATSRPGYAPAKHLKLYIYSYLNRVRSSRQLEMESRHRGNGSATSSYLTGEATTVHGLRSSFRDWAAECTAFPREVCERSLAHVPAMPPSKRRDLLNAWAVFLDG
jgi:transposase